MINVLSNIRTCRKCKKAYEATPHQIKKSDHACVPCRQEINRVIRGQRKALGLKVSGTQLGREWHQEYDSAYSQRPEVRQRRREGAARRREDPVERPKYLSRVATRNAVRRGDLKKQPCSVCGAIRVDAHHEDYSKPLQIMWLCREHHREHHKQAKAKGQTP